MEINTQSVIASIRHHLYEIHQPEAVDVLARHLKASGEIPYLKTLKEEFSRQVNLVARRSFRKNRSSDPLYDRQAGQAHARVKSILKKICQREINDRRLSTPTGWCITDAKVTDHDSSRRIWIVNSEYKYHYSNAFGDWWTGASYLCGYEDGQYFAVRIPRTITKIADALEWHVPAAVRKAQEEGRWVRRQGDVFLVALKRGRDNLTALPPRHDFRSQTRFLVHPEHRPVRLPQGPVRAYTARTLHGAAAD